MNVAKLSRMLSATRLAAASVVALVPGAAFAHPGHATADALGPLHYLVDAHGDMLPVAVVIGVGALAWLWTNRPQIKTPKLAPAHKPENDRKRR